MGTFIGIVIVIVVSAVIGFFVAGANPVPAAKWDARRRRILRGQGW
jgi:hypothetical protein